jgi:protein SCO1/2
MKKQAVFIFLILIVALGIGIWRDNIASHNGVTSWGQKSPLTVGTALPLPQAIPAFSLVDMYGKPFTEGGLKQHWSLMVFGYTSCPEICPTILKSLTQIHQHLSPQSPVESVFISIDPEHDTPDTLNTFFQTDLYKDIQIRALTGSKTHIQSLMNEVGLHVEEATQNEKHIGHSGAVLLINPEGKIAALFTRVDAPAAIARDIKSIMHRYSRG